jgi:hypothetical protein
MAAKGGKRTGAGRKKGVPNQVTTEIKEMIRGALDETGGQKYLVQQSIENPVAFMTLIGKIIPSDVNNKLSGSFTLKWQK